MYSTDRAYPRSARRAARAAAGALCALAAAGCADGSAGRMPTEPVIGFAPLANIRVHAGGAPASDRLAALSRAFREAVPDRVGFDFDAAALDAEARAAADRQAAWLQAHPGALVSIEGHTDLVGGEGYNQRLGLRRARAVADRLVRQGVAPRRIALVESRGESEPVVPVEARERRNRRAVTSVDGYGRGWSGREFDGKRALLGYQEYTGDETEAVVTEAAGG
jgi:outer membrane protein OmpA-like peptidoglycan-associated protein